MSLAARRHAYEKDGCVILPGYYDQDDVQQIVEQVEQFCCDIAPRLAAGDVFYEDVGTKAIKSLFRMQLHDEFFDCLARDQQLTDRVGAMFQEGEPVLQDVGFFAKPARCGSKAPVHQDNACDF